MLTVECLEDRCTPSGVTPPALPPKPPPTDATYIRYSNMTDAELIAEVGRISKRTEAIIADDNRTFFPPSFYPPLTRPIVYGANSLFQFGAPFWHNSEIKELRHDFDILSYVRHERKR